MRVFPVRSAARVRPGADADLRLDPRPAPPPAPGRPLRRAERTFNVLAIGVGDQRCAAHPAMDALMEAAQTLRMLGVDVRIRTSATIAEGSWQELLGWARVLVIVSGGQDGEAGPSAMDLAMGVSQDVIVCDPQVAQRTVLRMKGERRIDVLDRVDATSIALCWLETGAGDRPEPHGQ
ncbi:hypothetical protein J5X07_06680 [Actinomyces bowdenii]|uniref:hypothetical protein n=1 Tax=Actinomyces bowdenii TaxID=131109 RepID=UPI001ABCEDB2|nr:hypothetical protein [Actinomyces bowdenii]MBO3724716.1 hypothetical protein [Actinomyces bowdenii]